MVTRLAIALVVSLGTLSMCFPVRAWDRYADRVVDYWAGPGSNGHPEAVLGRPEFDVFTTGVGGWIIIEFTDYLAYDGPGLDLQVFRINEYITTASVYISGEGAEWEFIGTAQKDPFGWPTATEFDFGHDVGLVRFVKVVDDALPGDFCGYHLEAFGVLNGRVVPEPAVTAFAFGAVAPVLGWVLRFGRRAGGG